MTRRDAIKQGLMIGASVALPGVLRGQGERPNHSAAPQREIDVRFTLNGAASSARIDARTSVLDLLREKIGLTGTKKGCDHGQCGACTVLVDGHRVLSCLTLGATIQGKNLTTIEGIASGEKLHPVQRAFIEHDGFQCGYCTPGQIVSAVAFLREPWGPDEASIREGMSGNLCRCGAYHGIVAAIAELRKERDPS